MPAVLRITAAALDEDALCALVDLGAAEVEAQDDDLLGLFHEVGGDDLGARAAAALPGRALAVEPAVMVDWDSVWAASLRPVQVGELVIAPLGAAAPGGALVIEAGVAFGSARHPTTRLCLEWLEHRRTAGSVLDLGTGSGVLALAALRFGAARALGTDTDPAALEVAARNAARAGLVDRMQLGPEVPRGQRFDRVVANILASPLVEMAADLPRWLGPGGELCLSGFGTSLRADVVKAVQHVGLRVVGGDEQDGWCRVDAFAPW